MPEKEYVGERVPQEGNYVDEYGINHGQGVKIGETVWAPVNCGYHKANFPWGKLYQWGRKYGQGYSSEYDSYSDAVLPVIEEGGVSAKSANHSTNSNVFYLGDRASDYDWLSPPDAKIWNSGSESLPQKTIYDPCPEGWRVPTYSEFEALQKNISSYTVVDNKKGYWLSGPEKYSDDVPKIFLPVAGKRDCKTGVAGQRNTLTCYWSSRAYAQGSRVLWLDWDSVSLMKSITFNRAAGYPVRCVQE
jgi:uncharacterized protein (TIGR02145 family)